MPVRMVALATIVSFAASLASTTAQARPESARPVAGQSKKAKSKTKRGTSALAPTPAAEPPPEPTLEAPPVAAPPGDLSNPPPLSAKYKGVAMLPLSATDVGEDMVRAIEQSLLNEIDEKSGYRAISPRDVASEVASYQLDPDKCSVEDIACLARVGRFARAHYALVTRVGVFGGTINISLRLIDTQTANETSRVADSLSDKADERAAQLHRLAVQLFSPGEYVGTLIIKSDESGADVYLNDKLVGTTPLKQPLKNLAANTYILHVTKEGFADVYQFVDVTYNRTATITVNLATNTIAGALAVESETGFGQVFVVASEPDVEIRIDGEPKGLTPLEGAISQVAAGKRRLSLRRGGGPPLIREIPVEAGKRTDIGVTTAADGTMQAIVHVNDGNAPLPIDPSLVEPSTTAPDQSGAGPTSPEHHTSLLTAGVLTAGVGVVSLAVGSVFSAKVHSANSEADKQQALITAHQANTPADATIRANATKVLQDLNTSGPRNERNQWIFLGAGAGLVVVGGLMMAADNWHWFGIGTTRASARDPLAPTLKLGLVPTPGGGFMSLGGTF